MPTSDLKRIFDAADELGYDAPELRSGGHYCVKHRTTRFPVFFPATPSDHRVLDNVLAQLQQGAGKRLKKQKGYSGGQRISPMSRADMRTRTEGEEHSAQRRTELSDSIGSVDDEIRDVVERIELGRIPRNDESLEKIERLLGARERYADNLRQHLGVVPVLDIPGLDVLLTTASATRPATKADLDALRGRFS